MGLASETMASLGADGRRFCAIRKVRLGDVDQNGRLRLDALARYSQDVSNDDTIDAGLSEVTTWVVRRTLIDAHVPASYGETVSLTTFCGGLGRSWAERRVAVRGDRGAHYEVATLWIHLDLASGRPLPITEQFVRLYGETARGRKVKARLSLPKPAEAPETERSFVAWPTRIVDFDTQRHMNNAAYWAVVEEHLGSGTTLERADQPLRALLEYGSGIEANDQVRIETDLVEGASTLWWHTNTGVAATAQVAEMNGVCGTGAEVH